MSKPYGVVSDQHCHNWNAFSHTLANGENSRLRIILDELLRAAQEVKDKGGELLIDAGDVFHVRGSLAPSVLNPVQDTYRTITQDMGLKVLILSGNHDLEGKESSRLGSAVTSLEKVGCVIVNQPTVFEDLGIAMIPWNPAINSTPAKGDKPARVGLKEQIESIDPALRPKLDLFLHAPIDGVIVGLPDHGLDAAYLASLGFKRVFSGHYHNHKDMGDGIYSIGASTQQTWGDIGAKAGYLLVEEEKVNWRSTRAPAFVEIDGETDPTEIPMIVDGNYVRAKVNTNKSSEIEAMRSFLIKNGAKGVTILPQKAVEAKHARTGKSAIAAGASVEGSIGSYIAAGGFSNPGPLILLCNEILEEVRSSK